MSHKTLSYVKSHQSIEPHDYDIESRIQTNDYKMAKAAQRR